MSITKENFNVKGYVRKSIHSIPEVYQLVYPYLGLRDKKIEVIINDEYIKACSDRYDCFFLKELQCATCGIQASFFALENNTAGWHLNLYGTDADGKEVLFTKDHILPKSKGGRNNIENYQTMCATCNHKKGNKI